MYLPEEYPYKSPSVGFVNKIYHPNIDFAYTLIIDSALAQSAWTSSTKHGRQCTSSSTSSKYPCCDSDIFAPTADIPEPRLPAQPRSRHSLRTKRLIVQQESNRMHSQARLQRIVQTALTITPIQNHLRTIKLKTQPNRRITRKRPRVQQLLPQRTRLHQRTRRSQVVLM